MAGKWRGNVLHVELASGHATHILDLIQQLKCAGPVNVLSCTKRNIFRVESCRISVYATALKSLMPAVY